MVVMWLRIALVYSIISMIFCQDFSMFVKKFRTYIMDSICFNISMSCIYALNTFQWPHRLAQLVGRVEDSELHENGVSCIWGFSEKKQYTLKLTCIYMIGRIASIFVIHSKDIYYIFCITCVLTIPALVRGLMLYCSYRTVWHHNF